MIKKINYNFNRTKTIFNSIKFKSIFLLCIFCTLISSFNVPSNLMFENAIMYNISTSLYQFLLFFTLFLSSVFAMNIINKDYSSFLRFKGKKEYLISLFQSITIINAVTYIIYSIFGLVFVILKYNGNISFIKFDYYSIPYFIFNIYLYLKYFCIFNLLIMITILIYKNINKILGSIVGIAICVVKENYIYSIDQVQSIENIHLFYGYYLYPFEYSNFPLDLCAFFLQCILLLMIYESIKYLNIKYNRISMEE